MNINKAVKGHARSSNATLRGKDIKKEVKQ